MAKRGIEKIRGFEDFPCLEVLWMQENDVMLSVFMLQMS